MNGRTVAAWDGSEPAKAALEWALSRERDRDGTVVLVYVVGDSKVVLDCLPTEPRLAKARQLVEAEAIRMHRKDPDVMLNTQVRWGDPQLPASARRTDCPRRLSDRLATVTVQRLLKAMFVERAPNDSCRPYRAISQLLVGFDFGIKCHIKVVAAYPVACGALVSADSRTAPTTSLPIESMWLSGGAAVIEVVGLTKRYREKVAIDDISFSVEDGGVFAFVGTNGAGKSTTIGCLTTVLPFDAGTVLVGGRDVRREGEAVRESIGVVFQDSLLDPLLTSRENLQLRGQLSRVGRRDLIARIGELSDLIGLGEFLDQRYGRLSGGQRRRVDLARALLHKPTVLFLDEPTAGLDPASRALVWRTLHGLSAQGELTIFLTTHYLEETEEAARVCIIDDGRIIADDTPARLRAQHSRSSLSIRTNDPEALIALAVAAGADPDPRRDGDTVVIGVPGPDVARALLAAHGDRVRDFEFRHGRMDDVFLSLTGRSAPVEDAA